MGNRGPKWRGIDRSSLRGNTWQPILGAVLLATSGVFPRNVGSNLLEKHDSELPVAIFIFKLGHGLLAFAGWHAYDLRCWTNESGVKPEASPARQLLGVLSFEQSRFSEGSNKGTI